MGIVEAISKGFYKSFLERFHAGFVYVLVTRRFKCLDNNSRGARGCVA